MNSRLTTFVRRALPLALSLAVPQTPATGFGERAYFLYPKRDNQYQGNAAFLVAKTGNHTLALSLDAPRGKPAESMRPALESLMKSILARLP